MDLDFDDFYVEMIERFNEMELILLNIEDTGSDSENIAQLFRVVHTIKGTAGMFHFERIVKLTHQFETYFSSARDGLFPVSPPVISLTFRALDICRDIINNQSDTPHFDVDISELITDLETFTLSLSSAAEDEKKPDSHKVTPKQDTIKEIDPDSDIITDLSTKTISILRDNALKSVASKQDFSIDLAHVTSFDNSVVNFLCSLVPLFVKNNISLQVSSIPTHLVKYASSQGINLKNVLKRANNGKINSEKKYISEFTVTLHPALGSQWEHSLSSITDLTQELKEIGTIKTTINSDEVPSLDKLNPEMCYLNAILIVSTDKSRDIIESYLEDLPKSILWTLSLTPTENDSEADQINVPSVSTDTHQKQNHDISEWADLLSSLLQDSLSSTDNAIQSKAEQINELQKSIRENCSDMDEQPLSTFRSALKIIYSN